MMIYGLEECKTKPIVFGVGYLSSYAVKNAFFLNCLYLSRDWGGGCR
jgi:hypothetical protein